MNATEFVYWLQGYFEISQHSNEPQTLNEKQIEEIKNHLKLVLTKVTPDLRKPDSLPFTLPNFPNNVPQFDLYKPKSGQLYCGLPPAKDATFLEQFEIDAKKRQDAETQKEKVRIKTRVEPTYVLNKGEPGRAC